MSIIDQINSGTTIPTDLRRRFGYSAGVPNLVMDGKKSGLKCNPIDGGSLLPFYAGRDGYKGGLKPNGEFQQAYIDILPAEYAYRVATMFQNTTDMGYRTLEMLTDLSYEVPPPKPNLPRAVDFNSRRQDGHELAEHNRRMNAYHEMYNDTWYRANDHAYAYFDVVHPVITTCEYGLNQKIQLRDAGVQPGELFYQHCPTCRLQHLKSDACAERIYASSVTMDSKVLADLRSILVEANEAALRFVEANAAMVAGDISKRMTGSDNGRANLNVIDRIHLKMMHKTENAQLNTQTEMMRVMAQEIGVALRTNQAPAAPVLSDDEYAEFLAFQAKKKEAQERMANARAAKTKKEEGNAETDSE